MTYFACLLRYTVLQHQQTEVSTRAEIAFVEGQVNMKVYLDIYFILNFIMNYFLMCITGILRQKRLQPVKWGMVSGIGGLVSTLIYAWSCLQGKEFLLLDLLGLPLLVALAYHEHSRLVWIQDTVFYALAALLTGGCLYAMLSGLMTWKGTLLKGQTENQTYSIWVILSGVILLSVVFLLLGQEMLHQVQYQKNIGEAKLIHQGKQYQIRILYDSGNQLISPYTGERVAVISKDLADRLNVDAGQNPIYIPYRSIGGAGVLPAYRLERLEWSDRESMEHFLVAVSERLEQQEIQMILNIT